MSRSSLPGLLPFLLRLLTARVWPHLRESSFAGPKQGCEHALLPSTRLADRECRQDLCRPRMASCLNWKDEYECCQFAFASGPSPIRGSAESREDNLQMPCSK